MQGHMILFSAALADGRHRAMLKMHSGKARGPSGVARAFPGLTVEATEAGR